MTVRTDVDIALRVVCEGGSAGLAIADHARFAVGLGMERGESLAGSNTCRRYFPGRDGEETERRSLL